MKAPVDKGNHRKTGQPAKKTPAAAPGRNINEIHLAGAPIVLPQAADAMTRLAAGELARYLLLLTAQESPLVHRLPRQGPAIVLDREQAKSLGENAADNSLGKEGFSIRAGRRGAQAFAAILAGTSRGMLHGVYALLEELGVRFHLGGDALPDRKTTATLPLPFNQTQKPAFATRGVLIHDNMIIGTTSWGLADYQFHFNQLAHLRCNTFMLGHYGDAAAEVWDESDGRLINHWPILSSLDKKWGATRALRTAQFSFGTGDCFDEEIFSCPAAQTLADPIAQREEAVRVFREATRYASAMGIKVACGFWAPIGDVNNPADPTDPRVVDRFKERIRRYLARNPYLGYFVLLNHESGGCCGTAAPKQAGAARQLFESQRDRFKYLGNPRRVWEAIRFAGFARIAYDVLQETAPRRPLVLCGWGGDRWMRFADYFPGYDKLLPPDIIFSCFDNIDASYSNTLSTPLGELPPTRQRWAVPWVEADGTDCCTPQPNVESLRHLAPDALRKGCHGLLTMHWSTRDAEEEADYAARFGWDTTLTPEKFYQRSGALADHLLTLQRLGRRWTGVMGSSAVGEMVFTGSKPHVPFELDGKAIEYLLPMARTAAQKLSAQATEQNHYEAAEITDIPTPATDHEQGQVEVDPSQLGVKEYLEAIRRLEGLVGENNPDVLRRALGEISETLWAVRTRLIERWMSPAQFCATDLFLIRLHQLLQYAGVRSRWATLQRIRADLAGRREHLGPGQRDRLDYLAATMDFVMNFDRVAMLLADGEEVDRVLQNNDASQAAQAYAKLVTAGMRDAVLALTRKLTTRCEFGVLATVNTKPLGLYWDAIERLEKLMPAAPPREIMARLHGKEVHLWWSPFEMATRANGFHVYRQAVGTAARQRVTDSPLPAEGAMFIDRPRERLPYRYTVTAVDGSGRESPHSHPVDVNLQDEEGPRIVACQPPSVVEAGQPLEVRIVAIGERTVTNVTLHYRTSRQPRWQTAPMLNRFRHSYHAVIAAQQPAAVALEWFVEATDESGKSCTWPLAARQDRPWTATIINASDQSPDRDAVNHKGRK